MLIGHHIKKLAGNDVLHLAESIFALGPEYHPALSANRLEYEPLSFIAGEHPSAYSVSPLMWNAEFKLRGTKAVFIPIDIPVARERDLSALLDIAFAAGKGHFRVLTITNPYKIRALEYFRERAREFPGRIVISEDAERIGATNQILVGPDNVFRVINSDGEGMANAVDAHLALIGKGAAGDKNIGIVGAGGAARGIAYEFAKRASEGAGSVVIFNRTESKAAALAAELARFFPTVRVTAYPLGELSREGKRLDALVSAVTEGDPLSEYGAYAALPQGALVVDARYGANSVLAAHAVEAGRSDLVVRDGTGMVVEGYLIPSRLLGGLWGYRVPASIYKKIAALFHYAPKR